MTIVHTRRCWPTLLILLVAAPGRATAAATERVPALAEVRIRHVNGRSQTTLLAPGEFLPIAYDRPMFYLYRGGSDLLIEQKGPVFSVRVDGGPARLAGVRAGKERAIADPVMRKRLAEAAGLMGAAEDETDSMAALKDAVARRVTPLTITCDAETLRALPPIPQGIEMALVAQGDDLAGLAPFVARCPGLAALSVYAGAWTPDAELFKGLTGLTSLSLELRQIGMGLMGDDGARAPVNEVKDLVPLADLTHLRVLVLRGRFATSDLRPLAKLTHLVSLTLDAPPREGNLAALSGLSNLERLSLGRCFGVTELSALAPLERLTALDLGCCSALEDISALARLGNLTRLSFQAGQESRLNDLSPLTQLGKLRELSIYGLSNVRDLRPLAALRRLKSLRLRTLPHVRDVEPIGELTNLADLLLGEAPNLRDIEPLGKLTNLTQLSLMSAPAVGDIAPLRQMKKLESLGLHGLPNLAEVTPLAGLPELKALWVSECPQLRDLRPLADLANLTEVSFSECEGVADLSPLARLRHLTTVSLRQCGNVRDLTPLRPFVKRGGQISLDGNTSHEKVKQLREETDF